MNNEPNKLNNKMTESIKVFMSKIRHQVPITLNSNAKKRALNAVAITRDDYDALVNHITRNCMPRLRKIFKESKYADLVGKPGSGHAITTFEDSFKLDISTSRYHDNNAFSMKLPLLSVYFPALEKEVSEYNKKFLTAKRMNVYIDTKMEEISELIDEIIDVIYTNELAKKNLGIVFELYTDTAVLMLYSERSFVLNTSKYLN